MGSVASRRAAGSCQACEAQLEGRLGTDEARTGMLTTELAMIGCQLCYQVWDTGAKQSSVLSQYGNIMPDTSSYEYHYE